MKTKEEKLKFVLSKQENNSINNIKRCIELINTETDVYDYELMKKITFNKNYLNNIIILSVNFENYNSRFLINYFSIKNNMFCFSHINEKDMELYKSLVREKNINSILND